MGLRVVADEVGHRIEGDTADVQVVYAFLEHLSIRNWQVPIVGPPVVRHRG
jgi:hypothetical protein